MLGFVRRIADRLSRRSLDAAGHGRRFDGAKRIDNFNTDVFNTAATIRARSAHLARNHPWIIAGVNSLVANLVGTGIVPQPRHPDPAVSAALRQLFEAWTDDAGMDDVTDFYGLQALAVRAMIETGEAFIRLRVVDPAETLSGVPLKLELLAADLIPTDMHQNLQNGHFIRAGVEFDPDGRRVAYHVFPRRPADPWGVTIDLNPVRVPASEMIHLFEPLVPGQVRGLSRIAAVLLRSLDLDGFEDAALMRAKIAALMCAFIRDPDGTAGGMAAGGTQTGSSLELSMEPGSLIPLPPGADITLNDPKTADQAFEPFIKHGLRAIAAGLGCTFEQLSGDYAGVTYSSVRASLVEFRRRAEMVQHGIIVHQLCRPVYARFAALVELLGLVPGVGMSAAAQTAAWLPPAFDWVDPSKDVAAEIQEIDAGLKSRSMAAAERGMTAQALDEEIAADHAREKSLGLAFGATAPAQPQQQVAA